METSQLKELNPITYHYILVILIVIIVLFFSYNLIRNTLLRVANVIKVLIPRIDLIYI